MNVVKYIKIRAIETDLGVEKIVLWLAKELGMSRGGIYKWITGERKPCVQNAIKLAKLTNGVVTVEDCLGVKELAQRMDELAQKEEQNAATQN